MGKIHFAKLARWLGALALVIAVGLPVFAAQAGEITQKGRDTYHCADDKYVEIGDVPDHWVGVFDCEGISSTEGVEAGIFEFRGIGDYIAGMGPEQGYYAVTYDDGSIVRGKFEDILVPDEGGKSSTSKGTYQITNGQARGNDVRCRHAGTCRAFPDGRRSS